MEIHVEKLLVILDPYLDQHRTESNPLKSLKQIAKILESDKTQLSRANGRKTGLSDAFALQIARRLGKNEEQRSEILELLREYQDDYSDRKRKASGKKEWFVQFRSLPSREELERKAEALLREYRETQFLVDHYDEILDTFRSSS